MQVTNQKSKLIIHLINDQVHYWAIMAMSNEKLQIVVILPALNLQFQGSQHIPALKYCKNTKFIHFLWNKLKKNSDFFKA